jgi:hypothetical protein
MRKIEDHYHCPECGNILDKIADKTERFESFKFLICRGSVDHLYRARNDLPYNGPLTHLVDEYSLKYAREHVKRLQKKLKKAKKK